MTVVRSVFQGRTWQHAALRLVPLHRVRWFTTDSLGLCSAVFSFLPRWVLGLELLKKYYALLTKYSDSRLQLKKCATVLNTMKAGRQVRVGGICSSPLPFDLNQHWLSGMMFIADFKTNFQFKKMTQGRGKVCKTDGEIYWNLLWGSRRRNMWQTNELFVSMALPPDAQVNQCVGHFH